MTIVYDADVRAALDAEGIQSVRIDRDRKPDYVLMEDGRYEEWGTFDSLKAHSSPEAVQAVIDPGGFGYEPVVRLVAENLDSLRDLLVRIVNFMANED